ncbi:MAG: RodZ domain-containing protein [Kangiellaceae bacterium]
MNSKNTSSSDNINKDQTINIGSLLAEARNNLDLSMDDIASHLNLSIEIINQLEDNQFSGSLPLAFMRGYVISYAMKVGLDVELIKTAFDNQVGEDSVSLKRVESLSVFEKNRNKFNSNNPSIKIVTFLIIMVILFFVGRAGWEKYKPLIMSDDASVMNEFDSVEPNASQGTVDLQLDANETKVDDFSAEIDGSVTEFESGNSEEVVSNPKASESLEHNVESSLSSGVSDSGDSSAENQINVESVNVEVADELSTESLTLSFSDECWVQIIDASGNELAFGIKKSGKLMSLQGVPPISVVLGDPSVVELTFKNEPIELSHYRAKRRANIILE